MFRYYFICDIHYSKFYLYIIYIASTCAEFLTLMTLFLLCISTYECSTQIFTDYEVKV